MSVAIAYFFSFVALSRTGEEFKADFHLASAWNFAIAFF